MQEIDLTWKRVLTIWWHITWRVVAMAVPVAVGIGIVLGIVSVLLGYNHAQVQPIAQVIGVVIAIPIYWVALRMAIQKRYRDFRLAIVRVDPDVSAPAGLR